MKKRLIKAIVIAAVVVGIAFGGFYVYKSYSGKKAAATTLQYYAVTVKKMDLQETIQQTGTAYAAVTRDVSANNSGTIKDLNVKVGDTVSAGQKLFVSDSDELRKNVTTAKNNISKQELALSSDENSPKADSNKITEDKLSLSDAQSQLSAANEQLSNMTVTSPIAGVVTAVNNSNGNNVSPGSAVLTIVDMNSIKVKVSVDELDINKVSKGQKAQIKFDAIDGKTYEGSIETVAPVGVTNNNVTTYDVVTSISDTSGIKPGMNANVTIQISSKKNALVIPAEALIESNGGKYVRVESGNSALDSTGSNPASDSPSQGGSSKANTSANLPRQATSDKGKLTEIKTGLETENYIEVTEGLTEGEKVLVQLPAAESTNNANRNNFSGLGGNVRGGFGSNAPGSFGSGANANPSGNSSGTKSQTNSETKN